MEIIKRKLQSKDKPRASEIFLDPRYGLNRDKHRFRGDATAKYSRE